jgi:hemerythrin-like domain-containing protein
MGILLGQTADHGFDQPLGLLSDCHRRIERFLDGMLIIARTQAGQPLTADSRRFLEQALAYFRTAAPRHTADEEESLFPRLRASRDRAVRRLLLVVERLEADHRLAEAGHARADLLVRQWFGEHVLHADAAEELVDVLASLRRIYDAHIVVEDHELFPAAGRLLTGDDLEDVGREMAQRRGVPFENPVGVRLR